MSARLTVARPDMVAGMAWIRSGWSLFMVAPIPWMGMTAAAFLAMILLASIPVAGKYLVEVVSPLLVAGFMAASRAAESRQPVTFIHLAEGFRRNAVTLATLGGVYLAGTLLVNVVVSQMAGTSLQDLTRLALDPQSLDPKTLPLEDVRRMMDQAVPALLVGMLLMTPLLMATWFAPALALFEGFSAPNALWWSLWACAVNWRPVLYYSLVLGLAGFVALLMPFGLGLLLFLPIVMTSTYGAYRMIIVPRPVVSDTLEDWREGLPAEAADTPAPNRDGTGDDRPDA